MALQCRLTYHNIVSVENIAEAWKEFLNGKRSRKDVREFGEHLMDHVLALHGTLRSKTYRHGGYHSFNISDPKPRIIHKASVRDRLLHHAIYRQLYPFFDRTFVSDSYSCRDGKGIHKALNRFRTFSLKVSRNSRRTAWVLKCDIRKFFASIDHAILLDICRAHISDSEILSLLKEIVSSFETSPGKGLPLGNLTSQLFANVYMNRFDQFVKHQLKTVHYIRYADDFVLLSEDYMYLRSLIPHIQNYLKAELALELHSGKLSISSVASGVDFLGWVHFPDHRVLRTATKRRMFRNLVEKSVPQSILQKTSYRPEFVSDPIVASYLGMLSHGNARQLQREVTAYAVNEVQEETGT